MEYTVIGDHVNIGSRLEGLTKEFGADILVSEFTLKKIESLINDNRFGHLTISFIGDVNIRGKESQIKIYELIPLEHSN
jgi:adenylate cyclase